MKSDVAPTIRHLDVCAGLGLFSLGLRLADPRVRTVGFVERQAYCAAVLLARMEDAAVAQAPVFCGELQDVDGRELRGEINLITAGFPCQPWSAAGKRLGTEDERWIWPAIRDLIADVGPSAVMLENVSPEAIRIAREDLGGLGFVTCPTDGPLRVAADDVGAPHRRARYFLLAYAPGFGERIGKQWRSWRRARRVCDEGGAESRHHGEEVADPDRASCAREWEQEHGDIEGAPGDVALGHGADRLVEWPPGPDGDWSGFPAETQPGFPGTPDGNAARVERVHALGNGVLPQVVAAAWAWFMRTIR